MTDHSTETAQPVTPGDETEAQPQRRAGDDPHRPEFWQIRIIAKLVYQVGKDPEHAEPHDWYMASAVAMHIVES